MGWKKKSIPAVLLLSLAVPPAQAQRATHAAAEPTLTALAEGTPRTPSASGARVRGRRRNDSEGGISPATLAKACEYLSARADGREPDAGTGEAWNTFYQWCDAHIRRFAGALGLRGAQLDDCAQEVWADLTTRLRGFQLDTERGHFTSWLYTLVRNKRADLVRREARRPAASLSQEAAGSLSGREDDPALALERHDEHEFVRRALAKLRRQVSDLSYRVLHLSYFHGLDASAVADSLGISPQQVWVREHRTKRKLGEILRSTQQRLRLARNFA